MVQYLIGTQGSAHKLRLYYLLTIPILFIILLLAVTDRIEWALLLVAGVIGTIILTRGLRILYAILFFVIPFSAEVSFPQGFSVYLPGEPILVLLTILFPLILVTRSHLLTPYSLLRPIPLLLIGHLLWIFISALFAANTTISFKFLIAKLWYVIPFYSLLFLIKPTRKDYVLLFKALILGVMLAAFFVFIRHAQAGFSFDTRTNIGAPIFRNHVNYACLLTLALPIVWYLFKRTKSNRWIWAGVIIWLIVFQYFTYARVVYLCVIGSVAIILVVKARKVKHLILTAALIVFSGIAFLYVGNKYLDFAPEYEQTISQEKFGKLLTATYRMEDISMMERLYRWVAAAEMIKGRPLIGYGPGNFYSVYKAHTVTAFQTYVSNNPDKSGVHNYFLMLASEQGVPGLVLFLFLLVASFIEAEKQFHLAKSTEKRLFILCIVWILSSVVIMNLINDMFEVIKVGPFFFMALFILSNPPREAKDHE